MPYSIIIYMHREKCMVCKNHSDGKMGTDGEIFSATALYTKGQLT